ncbi:MAG: energy-coupling factor transporter transmembrane component T [Erysipelotrichaceae bacterium]
MNEFSRLHPLVLFAFFLSVIVLTVVQTHPIYILISLLAAKVCAFKILGFQNYKKRSLSYLLIFLIVGLSNPVFSHKGATILFYLNDNPFTLEATIYGFVFAAMLIAVLLWCEILQKVMSSDKILYLFSKSIPAIGLMLTMTLRFIPKFASQAKSIRDAQKFLGNDISQGSLLHRIKSGVSILSMLITYAFETSVDTADSMKSRGYGSHKRTNFTTYLFTRSDGGYLFGIVVLFLFCFIMLNQPVNLFYYYPLIQNLSFQVKDLVLYLGYICLFNFAFVYEIKEERKWKS